MKSLKSKLKNQINGFYAYTDIPNCTKDQRFELKSIEIFKVLKYKIKYILEMKV